MKNSMIILAIRGHHCEARTRTQRSGTRTRTRFAFPEANARAKECSTAVEMSSFLCFLWVSKNQEMQNVKLKLTWFSCGQVLK